MADEQDVTTAVATQDQAGKKPALNAGGGGVEAIIPRNVEEAYRLAQVVVGAGLAPSDAKKPEEVLGRIVAGMEVGLNPMQAVQSIALVNGRPVLWGDGLIALVRGSGLCKYISEWAEGEGDKAVAYCRTQRLGEPEPVERSFSMADAKTAGLAGKTGPWKSYPKRMLQMRARGFALRDAYPDVIKGIGVREEQEDARYHERADRAPRGGGGASRGAQIIEQARAPAPPHDPETGEIADAVDATPCPPDQPAPGPATQAATPPPAGRGTSLAAPAPVYNEAGDKIGTYADRPAYVAAIQDALQRASVPALVVQANHWTAAAIDSALPDWMAQEGKALAEDAQDDGQAGLGV